MIETETEYGFFDEARLVGFEVFRLVAQTLTRDGVVVERLASLLLHILHPSTVCTAPMCATRRLAGLVKTRLFEALPLLRGLLLLLLLPPLVIL